ncbi:MAG: SLC13 family permease [Gemmatimonadota bacterium]
MTPDIALLLGLLTVALVLFATEWVTADVTALTLMLTLIITGLLPADRAFEGFGSDTVMMILGLLILTASLLRTGVVDRAGRAILRRAGTDDRRLLVLVVVLAAVLSAFISNTAATAFFLPIAMGVALRARVSPSRFLLPMAFASILTSSVTLISTSTNIVVSGLMTDYGLEPIGMFELAPVGIPIAIVGVAYVLTIGRRLMPSHPPAGDLTESFGLGPYLTEILILPKSKWIGQTLAETGLGRDLDLTVLRIVREKTRHLAPRSGMRLEAADVVLVEGVREEILKIKDTAGIAIKADAKLANPDLPEEDVRLVEAVILPGSQLIGRRLKGARFRERYGLQVLAINRHAETLRHKLSEVRLRLGDVLLVQGHQERIGELEVGNVVRILGEVEGQRPNLRHAKVAILIFVVALGIATFKILPLPVAMLSGAALAFLTRCITPQEAYREIEWKALILIGSMLSLGAAMEATGAAEYLAAQIIGVVGTTEPILILSGFFVLTLLLTQPMSNQAAAIVVVPLAIQTALQLELDPRPFAIMIAVAASCSYLTPLEPSCLMVYGPGRYRFMDFFRVGALLTLLIYGLAIVIVPAVWPL